MNIKFFNNNEYDLRKKNINYYHFYHDTIIKKYPNAKYIHGHHTKNGKDAYIMKNPLWEISDNKFLMYCEKNKIIFLDSKALNILKEFENKNNILLSHYLGKNGYIISNPCKLYIHQIITDCYGNGKGTKKISVDHIDQDPSNNCYSNLRIANRKTQELNCNGIKNGTKRQRKKNAKELPPEIKQDMIPKYVVYYKECYNKEKNLYREFFKIEKHEKYDGTICSSKSNKISITEKLEEIKLYLKNIDENKPIKDNKKYPVGIQLKNLKDNKKTFILDYRSEGKRYNLKMKCNNSNTLDENYEIFKNKVLEKYPDYNLI